MKTLLEVLVKKNLKEVPKNAVDRLEEILNTEDLKSDKMRFFINHLNYVNSLRTTGKAYARSQVRNSSWPVFELLFNHICMVFKDYIKQIPQLTTDLKKDSTTLAQLIYSIPKEEINSVYNYIKDNKLK